MASYSDRVNSSAMEQGIPSTAPVRGKRGKRDGNPDDWLAALKRHGLLDEPLASEREAEQSISAKFLREGAAKRREQDEKLLEDTQRVQEQYEKACLLRMGEATRFAQFLGLRKIYNPIHIRANETSGAPGAIGKAFGHMGELRCEVVAKEDSHSRIISCSLFDREFDRLKTAYQRKRREEDQASAASTALALASATYESGDALPGSPSMALGSSPVGTRGRRGSSAAGPQPLKRRASRKTIRLLANREEDTYMGRDRRASVQGRRRSSVGGSPGFSGVTETDASGYDARRSEVDNITIELCAVLEETHRLDEKLREQQRVLTENGWNLGRPRPFQDW
ncbi:Hypothetical Protein FCC1311_057262 [Hondaea fermentalgiana]|uniref:Uncharacterized protein n=1 Tax=Hondaea fermentalgiana TaxID=2315210 RepID=A0A2R5GFX4_9STRA|nr:Hypothetical Protein FCC1311_057262 [Hondaea fermentalgiana]|eukprot:GBG29505.1 Hypothetical Protein FCC1311_057262 [Hondaea fermentalgiana]